MMPLDVNALGTSILTAIKGVLDDRWPEIRDYATGESQKLAHSIIQITTLHLSGQISEGECSVLLEMQKNATRAVLLAIQGMGIIMVEMALNAAIGAVREVVNGTIGFALL